MVTMLERVYTFAWILVHLFYVLSRELIEWVHLVWNQCSRGLSSCWPQHSIVADYSNVVKDTQGLKKYPQHIAFLVTPQEADSTNQVGILQKIKFLMTRSRKQAAENAVRRKHHLLDVSTLSKLVAWSWAANVPVITLYDYYGEIKELQEDLMYSIQDEIETNLWSVRKARPNAHIPKVIFHDIADKNIPITKNGRIDSKSLETIHIILVSYEDGKSGIVKVAKSICTESLKKQNLEGICPSLIKEAQLDDYFSSRKPSECIPSDPDILVISGHLKSTLGFLPWNIRLSEIFWVPKLPLVESAHLVNVLETFSGCQQRFGT